MPKLLLGKEFNIYFEDACPIPPVAPSLDKGEAKYSSRGIGREFRRTHPRRFLMGLIIDALKSARASIERLKDPNFKEPILK
jgi:hypothetical protein